MNYRAHGEDLFDSPDLLEDHPLPETLAEAEHLAASIERAVWEETAGNVLDLRVEVNRDGILLKGRCSNYYVKQKAQQAAMALSVDSPLSNQIEVA